tara:strand:- start:115 stop:402 length:288 start_codon:yes stop_codon:yes gene_type:complete
MTTVNLLIEGKQDMSMRDKIADIIRDGELQMITYQGIADAIAEVLPDYDAQQARIAELEEALMVTEKALHVLGVKFDFYPVAALQARKALKGEIK